MADSATPLLADELEDNQLEIAIGAQVRSYRRRLGMTLQDVGHVTGVSSAMLSKVENGQTSPSLGTLKSLAKAFDVPINVLFKGFEERRDASFVPSGEGVRIARRGRSIDHDYRLIGHSANSRMALEPYLVRLTGETEVFPRTQETGVWFLHVLEGEMVYRYGDKLYPLTAGDSLTYDADAPHGIDEVRQPPVTFLCIHADRRDSDAYNLSSEA
jgi:transcriptional regulator with XRE-family HTH domain